MPEFSNSEKFLFNRGDCAIILGVHPDTVTRMQTQPVKGKVGGEKFYDIRELIKERLAIVAGDSDTESLTRERTRLTRVQADKIELEMSIAAGRLIEATKLEYVLGNMLANFKSKLLAMPVKMSGLLLGIETQAEIEAVLERAVYEALNELKEFKTESQA